ADTELFTRPLFDLERVEILKGPQGALYGRSAIAGVFNVQSNRPTPEFEAYVDAGYGNGETWRLETAAGGPIAGETLMFRASALFQDSEGFIRNTFLDKKVDGFQTNNARFQLTARPSETVDIHFKLSYLDEEGGAAYVSSADVTGDAGGRLAGDILQNPFGDFEGRSTREWLQLSARIDWQVGGGVLSSITAWDDYDKTLAEELDFRNDKPITFFGFPAFPNGIQPIFQPIGIEVFTQEVRYTSSSEGWFRWIVGAFFQDISRDRTDDFGPLLFGAEAPLIATDITQFAFFAQASYDITQALELTAALRYDRDERDEVTSGVDSGVIFSDREASFDEWQPKISLSYDLSDDHMIYGTAALGFKPGGFNVPPGPNDPQMAVFPEEQTLAFEVGAKTRWLDGRLSADLALFYTDYDNFQNTIFLNGVNTVLSVDEVDVKGLEVALRGDLGGGFTTDLGFAYTESKIGPYIVPDPLGSGQMV
ncbi:MAG: TonB-dependent receptor, partial [Alphaproteobacteria bacterium]|nr:TonB-dependent receptor [Alphaproteobacteria bacterium]